MSAVTITTITPDDFEQLEQLQRLCYPTLGLDELMQVKHFASQYQIFPKGQFVAHIGNQVVGQGSGFLIDFDFDHPRHRFREICAELYFTNHDPNGAYYYAADISVHPEFRKLGIGRRLYQARQDLTRRYNRRGIVGGGLIPGYAQYKARLSVEEYVAQVVAGKLSDPTLTFQLRNGFQVRGLIENYLEDSASDNWSTLIVWENPEFREQ
jgi:ribosomal protein S18 acetylase RimI-like enzyme